MKAFLSSLRLDVGCVETVEYVLGRGLLSKADKAMWLKEALLSMQSSAKPRLWLESYYRYLYRHVAT